jgi:hypothetical protein
VNAAEAAVLAAMREKREPLGAAPVVPEGLPTHGQEMAQTGLDVPPVADDGTP